MNKTLIKRFLTCGFIGGGVGMTLGIQGCYSPNELPTASLHPCPTTRLIQDLSRQTLKDTQGVPLATIEIDAVRAFCQATETETDLTIQVDFTAFPHHDSEKVSLTYFIALADANHQILHKDHIPFRITFDKRQSKVQVTDYFKKVLSKSAEKEVANYHLYVGLQMDREEWQRNKNRPRLAFH